MRRVNTSITKTVSKLGKMPVIAIIAMFIANTANAQQGANMQPAIRQSIKTVYPTKDWVIADFVVTDPRFGAKARPGFRRAGVLIQWPPDGARSPSGCRRAGDR